VGEFIVALIFGLRLFAARGIFPALILGCMVNASAAAAQSSTQLRLVDAGYFAMPGFEVLAFSNTYDGNFSDSKIAGVEFIHHGVRTATNGDVRLSPTPEQWDPVPTLKRRDVRGQTVVTRLAYEAQQFEYEISVEPRAEGVVVRVHLDRALPPELVGKAGFNLEFLPSAYFHRGYLLDTKSGTLPLYPAGPTGRAANGEIERLPLARGKRLVLAPEDVERRVAIESNNVELALFDGRNQAQNGWYVVRSLLPADTSGVALEWFISASAVPGWVRPAMIAHSQVGYHPSARKVAIVEMDRNAPAPGEMQLLRVREDGSLTKAASVTPTAWGEYLRYRYFTFDFTQVREPGLYLIEGAGQRTHTFRIASDVYADAWHPTLDVFFPVQMDHMFVNEAYRVWHGASHMDDARQAPVDHEHFDLYKQGPTTDSPFQPGDHIPGLNIGGWFDAGDFDLRTQTHYATVRSLVNVWEKFRPMRDETSIDQARRHVELHHPDGTPDLLQQIEHGVLMLIAQHRVFGHAIPGIVEPDIGQYTHLGDAVTKTDGRVDDPARPDSAKDDRWAFTTATTALNYGSAAALAAASRALRGYRNELAEECLAAAVKAWNFEKGRQPNLFRFGNTTGGHPEEEELTAAIELLVTTGDKRYAARIAQLWPTIDTRFAQTAGNVVKALPKMDRAFATRFRQRAAAYRRELDQQSRDNPFGVPITRTGWAGNGAVIGFALTAYELHTVYPELFAPELTLRGLDYLYGTHPGSNISFVSAVGTRSKEVAYGSNRADFSFIAGGIVPGALILKPDFPENKEDWPFLWGENEYVINLGGSYIYLVHAADALLNPR
jgi:endoglucanase